MKARTAVAFAAISAAGALAVLSVGRASDHLDGPRVVADPQSDITDVFAFTSPEDPTKVVLAMAVTPYASDASTFSGGVDYAFRVQKRRRAPAAHASTASRSTSCATSATPRRPR